MIKLLPTRKLLSILNSFGVEYIYKNLNDRDIYKFIAPFFQFWASVVPMPLYLNVSSAVSPRKMVPIIL